VRILVVDDEKDVQGYLRLVLEEAGYTVECAGDGQEALQKTAVFRPDLVVLDLMMPVMDGWEVLRWLRSGGSPPPVVILSALAERRRALREGAAACLSKPFHRRELLLVCERALAASAEG
jgi:CheY-like chemotaxis protein